MSANSVVLVKRKEYMDFIDYFIAVNDKVVGTLDIRDTQDFIFIRSIQIKKEYRRNGYAKKAIDYLLTFHKPVKLVISEHSPSAAPFWHEYFKGKCVICERKVFNILNERKCYVS